MAKKVKRLADKILRYNTPYEVRPDPKSNQYGIFDPFRDDFISPDRWMSRRDAENYLAVGVMLKKI